MKKLLLLLVALISASAFANLNQLQEALNEEGLAAQEEHTHLMANVTSVTQDDPYRMTIDERLHLNPTHLNAQNNFGRTAIWYAALGGRNNIYDYLLSKGANPDIKSNRGKWAGFSAKALHDMSAEEIDENKGGTKL